MLDETAAALFGALASDRRLAPRLAELAEAAGLNPDLDDDQVENAVMGGIGRR